MLIDFHAHLFPDSLAPRAVSTLIAGAVREEGRALPPRGEATQKGILASMKREGVSLSVVLPIVTKPSQTDHILAFAEDINHRYADRLYELCRVFGQMDFETIEPSADEAEIPVVMSPELLFCREQSVNAVLLSFASVHPDDPNAEEVLQRIAEKGFRGIKLHPEFQSFDLASPRAISLIAKAESLGLITVVHAGRDIGMPPPVHGAPEQIAHLLDYIRGDRFVAAHLGGFRMWEDVERYLVGKPLFLDTSYLGFWDGEPNAEQMRRIIKNHGTQKVLFGSDYPWKSPREIVGRLRTLALSDSELAALFWRNAYRLLFS